MKTMLKRAVAVLAVLALTVVFVGCSKAPSGPKEEDVLKAVTSAIETSVKDATLKPPVTIAEPAKQTPSGDWQVKVKFTLAAKDGKTKDETKTYNLSSSINDMGVPVWMAAEAK